MYGRKRTTTHTQRSSRRANPACTRHSCPHPHPPARRQACAAARTHECTRQVNITAADVQVKNSPLPVNVKRLREPVRACIRVCVCACVHACVCMRACVGACVRMKLWAKVCHTTGTRLVHVVLKLQSVGAEQHWHQGVLVPSSVDPSCRAQVHRTQGSIQLPEPMAASTPPSSKSGLRIDMRIDIRMDMCMNMCVSRCMDVWMGVLHVSKPHV